MNIHTLLVGVWNGTATSENSLLILQKLNIKLPHDLAISLLSMHPKELKADNQTKTWMQLCIAALLTILKTTQISSNGWMDIQYVVYTVEYIQENIMIKKQ